MKKTKEFFEDFVVNNDGIFMAFEVGVDYINPERIVAINADVEEIKDSYRMWGLIDRVITYGWTNEGPFGFVVLEFPNGDLAVTTGNNRGYLSKELYEGGIVTSVKAHVYKLVNVEKMPEEVLQRLIYLEKLLEEGIIMDWDELGEIVKEKMEILQNKLYFE